MTDKAIKPDQREIDRRLRLLDEAEERAREYQTMELSSDYDEAIKEHRKRKQPLLVKFQGKRYEMPSSIPFSLSVFIMRDCIQKKKGPDGKMKEIFVFPDDKVLDFMERVFGKKFASAVMDSDIGTDFVAEVIIPDILGKWGLMLNDTPAVEKKTAMPG
jgi:hypothetical protein